MMEINKDPMFLRQIIMDNYSEPDHKQLTKDPTAILQHQASESCVDDIYVELVIKDHHIQSARFDGMGCAISTASTNIMAKQITGCDLSQALAMIENYLNMLREQPFDEDKLDELIAFINVHKQANRIKCASIGVKGYRDIITKYIHQQNGGECDA